MKFVKKIDLDSIHHSDGIYHIPSGPAIHVKVETYYSHNGVDWELVECTITRQQDIQKVYDSPGWQYSHLPVEVECKYCGHKCLDTELEEKYDDYDLRDSLYRICPNCKEYDCCEIEYQTLKEYNDSITKHVES